MKKIETPTTPLDAIKQKCYFDCCAEDYNEYKNCNCSSCALWQFRFGKNPYSKRNYTEEQRAKMAANLKANRRDRS